MQVKVGDRWYTTVDGPIMIAVKEGEKVHIGNMPKGIHRYAQFQLPECHEIYDKANKCEACEKAIAELHAWMDKGWDHYEESDKEK